MIGADVLQGAGPFTAESDLLDAGLDSMGLMRLVLAVESRFGVTLAPEALDEPTLRRLDRLAALVDAGRAADSQEG